MTAIQGTHKPGHEHGNESSFAALLEGKSRATLQGLYAGYLIVGVGVAVGGKVAKRVCRAISGAVLLHNQTIETRDSDSDGNINIDADIGGNGVVAATAAIAAVAVTAMNDTRPRNDDLDADEPPRGLQPPPAQGSLDAPDTFDSLSLCSGSAGDASNASNALNASNRSGRSSPRKRRSPSA